MKKIIATTFICVLFLINLQGQTLSEKQARHFLDKAWNYLKTNDTTSFINLWSLNDSISKHQERPHTRQEIIENFNVIKEWVDTALQRNLNIDHVLIEEQNLEDTDTEY